MTKLLNTLYLLLTLAYAAPTSASDNIYANTQAGMLAPAARSALARVYVPNGNSNTVSVIDPSTYKVVDTYTTGKEPQHVVPAYDLKTLWVLNNKSNSATPINPYTAKPGNSLPVLDPYNLYFTPDGKTAIVVCEGHDQLQFLDPHTMKMQSKLPVKCHGANHMDFTIDGRYAIVTCEFSAELMKVDIVNKQVVGYLPLGTRDTPIVHNSFDLKMTADGHITISSGTESTESMPQDIRSSADGSVFFVADMMKDGVVIIDPVHFTKVGFIPTGIGTHAIYPSRDGKLFYVSNRGSHHIKGGPHGAGSISVLDPDKRAVIATWAIPGGGSPDMGNVTADGKELWLSGRYDSEVYVFNTEKGLLTHRIPVGHGPHGLTVWPQPGEYSLGHTGNMR